jgi:hypothetical protein
MKSDRQNEEECVKGKGWFLFELVVVVVLHLCSLVAELLNRCAILIK